MLSYRFYIRILQNLFHFHSSSLYWLNEAQVEGINGIDDDFRRECIRIEATEEAGGN